MGGRINRTADINGKPKSSVNAILDESSDNIPNNNGYFGKYTVITYKKKKAIVYVDDRDGVVNVKTGWYDEIFYSAQNCWDGDYRNNHDKPILVKNHSKYNLVKPHDGKLLCEWFSCKTIYPTWHWDKTTGYVMIGYNSGKKVLIFKDGNVMQENDMLFETNLLKDVKGWSIEKITEEWINKNKPCAHICGLEYKGAHPVIITDVIAQELWKTHRSFGTTFNSAEWILLNGNVTLLFRDYAMSDYD